MPSSDRITLYIGTYTRRESFVDGKAEGIYIYHLDPRSGELTYAATVTGPGTINPSFVTVGPDKRTLYAVNEITGGKGPHGTVSAFAIDPVTQELRYLNQQSTHGLAPCYASVEPPRALLPGGELRDRQHLRIAGPARREPGRGYRCRAVCRFRAQSERQAGPHAHMVVPGPSANSVLAIDLGTDRLMLFHLDRERGTLSPADAPWTQLPPGAGPRHLAFHPHRPLAYVINELQSTVTVCRYDGQQGEFAPFQTVSTLPAGFTGENLGAEIMVAPSGRFVYASNRGHDSLAFFAVGPATGQLALVGHESTHGRGPRTFTIDPTGTLLLVANQDTDTVVTFWINQEAGKLRPTGHVATVPTPVCLHLASA